ncbi:MAG: N-acetylglucosamine-6-phosphate deacetylase [Synechococcales bacterium]|nr:N-acetylglucosamine-6-phosphate deacetylase [Synechococcales bacterium]
MEIVECFEVSSSSVSYRLPYSPMAETLQITNAQIAGYAGRQNLLLSRDRILAITPAIEDMATPVESSNCPILDVAGDWISQGGIDLQINGALGLAFPDLTLENAPFLQKIGTFLWQQGVDGYCPTLVTTSTQQIHQSLAAIAQTLAPTAALHPRDSQASDRPTAQILGVHLEGPFLNPVKRGAHPEAFIQPLTVETVKQVLGDYASLVKIITLAPEMDSTGTVIPYLRSLGITVSLGHSLATSQQAQQAFAQGATMVTHAFNAMPGLHHREPGLLGAAIADPLVACGVIADGEHVVPLMLDLLLKASDYDRGLFLVSDALAPLGLPDGCYPWDTRQIEVRQGTARLENGTLAGTTVSLLEGVQNLIQWNLCTVEQAIALATTASRRAIGLSTDFRDGSGHLLRWHLSSARSLTWERLAW